MIVRTIAPTLLVLAATLSACGPAPGVARTQALFDAGDYRGAIASADSEIARTPKQAELWRIKIRAALLVGDSAAAVSAYKTWRDKRGGEHDNEALSDMAELTLWRGLVTASAELNVMAIKAIERHQLVRLADEVTALIASDNDVVAATAAVAVLKDHPQAANVAAARLSSPDPRARATVIGGISRKIPERAAREIRDALEDPAAEVRRAAVAAVVLLKDRNDTAALVKLARSDGDDSVRTHAARAVAKKPYFPDLELAAALLNDPFLGAQLAALEIAQARSAVGGRDLLRRASQSDRLPLALRAAVLLGGGPGWKPLFERALSSDKWPVRASAIGAVLAATDRATALAAADTASRDPRREVRLAAALLYRRLGLLAKTRELLNTVTTTTTTELGSLRAAVILVNDFGDDGARRLIDTAGASADRPRRTAALAAMAELRGPISSALINALADAAPALRMQAADTLLSRL